MVLRELYMYEAVLRECSLIPVCYGVFQRPAGGWFGFLLEDVGDNLEKIYGPEWSGVKRGMSAMQWNKLIKSVKKLHSLGVEHSDLEPRNVAQTTEGFKFLILDGRDCIIVSKMSAGSWKIYWMCTFLENNYRAKINVRSGNTGKLFWLFHIKNRIGCLTRM
ncbi:hypothetical protein EV421DRAFT_187452 [Armillaria borealis]|uniref:Protein kinase domain-containing protein n=1 Tax=Armillaria borealis TaxID=47425 RepID=A0AA39JQQ7_9AGAR|nr:hypothetical protein EV421DRAFT_187452 [Armillaria borealis]